MKFSERLIALREEKGFSQTGLARALGVHRNTIVLLEKGERHPSYKMLIQFAKRLGMEPSQLMEGVDSEKKPPLPVHPGKATDSGERAGLSHWCESPASYRPYFNI